VPNNEKHAAAWDRFCDELKLAGDVVLRDITPGDELTRAEGYRHLVRMIRAGFESSCEFSDTRHPQVTPMATGTMLYEGVTPDARYHHAWIDGAATYRVHGRRGTAPLIEFSVYEGQTGLHPTNDLIGSLTEVDLQVEDDGSYEVVLSPNEHEGNWIRTNADAKRLFVRQYAHDWEATQSATYEIEYEPGTPRSPRPPLSMAELEDGLARTANFVATAPPFWAAVSEYWKGYAVNKIVPQEAADSSTDITVPSGHRFACGYFMLEPDEALVISFRPVEVPYWGLDLTSYWYEPLHFPGGRSNLHNRSATREADGSIRIVVSDHAPPSGNWLDSDGHREGTLVFRWSRTHEPIPEFSTEVVQASQVMA
jgi:hypothetical protein